MRPISIWSDSPVTALSSAPGMPHSGPGRRGNSTKHSTMIGTLSATRRAPSRRQARSPSADGLLKRTSAVVTSTVTPSR